MIIMPQTLNTMTFPLHGARLIEASAGTGKTFTISGLYLRLLLGHGTDQTKHQVPLSVDQILVVTFTEAATAELRERIRSKIHAAHIAFLRGESDDVVIADLLAEIDDHEWAAKVLLGAKRQMDEAAIYTIHGFCQRMLTQNAFESGSRFSNEFITDESKIKSQVVADYWRQNFYSLSVGLANEVRNIWPSPAHLVADIGGHISGAPLPLTVAPMAESLQVLHQENLAQVDQLKKQWLAQKDNVEAVITQSDVSKRSFTKKNLPAWLDEITTWAQGDTHSYQWPDKLDKFRAGFLLEKTPEGKVVPQHTLFDSIEAFLASPPHIKAPLMAHAIHTCRGGLQQIKQDQHWLSFDDLLANLSAAIDEDKQNLLVDRIRQLYPVAMIDEFQDTDPLQYSIFSRIYLPHPQSGLFMIGDPKQAIYGFRGADIFTYIRARNEVSDHYTLETNWRSSAEMVAASNALFKQSESPFMYNQDIPFYPVCGSPGAEQRSWQIEGKAQKALHIWLQESEQPVAKGDYLALMAEGTATKIADILQSSEQKNIFTGFVDSKGSKKSVEASDIAVLVRTGSEGQLVRQALAKKGVASVYLSNRDSVFASPMATSILRLLLAVLNPENERLLRAALASDILLKTSLDLDLLNENEVALEAKINAFKGYKQVWQQRGVMPMLRTIMVTEQIAENLLAQEFGERQLTDFLHLGELLQQASQEQDSDHALVRWFSELIQEVQAGEGSAAEEQIQRLESERNLVQIITIHKSKGLEYSLVFLPFISAYRESKSGQFYDQEKQETILDITKQPESVALADKERLAEDLRLLYVAVTRAVYGCFIAVSPLRKGMSRKDPTSAHLNAFGYLLQNGEEGSSVEFIQQVKGFCSSNDDCMQWGETPEVDEVKGQIELFDHDDLRATHDLKAKEFNQDIERSWRISSYSGLVKQRHGRSTGGDDSVVESIDVRLDLETALEKEAPQLDDIKKSIFTFPRGAQAGTFLHTIFEEVDFTLPATSLETTDILTKLLVANSYDKAWLTVLQQLVDTVMSAPLDGESMRLGRLGIKDKLVEMEFLLPVKHLSSLLFSRLSQEFDPLSKQLDALGFSQVKGMLKGFIDLVFVHQGKYYLLDWKSNHLGDDVADYNRESLEQAMAEHRYDFQYQIYALALHRFLRSRIPGYQFEQHFGGVYYLFLRGVDGSENGRFFHKPEAEFVEAFDKLIEGEQLEVQDAE